MPAKVHGPLSPVGLSCRLVDCVAFLRMQGYDAKLGGRTPWDLVPNLNRYSFIIYILLLPKLMRGGPRSIKQLN